MQREAEQNGCIKIAMWKWKIRCCEVRKMKNPILSPLSGWRGVTIENVHVFFFLTKI